MGFWEEFAWNVFVQGRLDEVEVEGRVKRLSGGPQPGNGDWGVGGTGGLGGRVLLGEAWVGGNGLGKVG